jgi:hypothetical protein
MKERNIALASLAAGSIALGLAAFIQVDRFAFTRGPRATLDLHRGAPSTAPQRQSVQPTPDTPLQLPPILITASRRSAQNQSHHDAPQKAPSQPCSDWREIGPATVVDGEASGTRRVRDLC